MSLAAHPKIDRVCHCAAVARSRIDQLRTDIAYRPRIDLALDHLRLLRYRKLSNRARRSAKLRVCPGTALDTQRTRNRASARQCIAHHRRARSQIEPGTARSLGHERMTRAKVLQ